MFHARRLFGPQDYAQQLRPRCDRKVKRKFDSAFQESTQDVPVGNFEYLVYYAKALDPGVNDCFVVSAYDVPTTTKEKMIKYYDEIINKV